MENDDAHTGQGIGPSDPSTFQQLLDIWLEGATPALAQAARFAALPHTFDSALLSFLRGTEEETVAYIANLQRSGLITVAGSSRYAFEPMLRGLFLQRWRSSDLETYVRANEQAVKYFETRRLESETDRLEYVYHLLAADEPAGFDALKNAFEGIWKGRRLGLAERLLQYAGELAPMLAQNTQRWLRLSQARLNLEHFHHEQSIEILRSLLNDDLEPLLRAEALMTLGHALSAMGRWTEALDSYGKAEAIFSQIDDGFNASRALEAQGMVYLRLTSSLGGLYQETDIFLPAIQIWFRRIVFAPFLLYQWLSRRIDFLPSLYFGANYQDWIIFRLFYEALHKLERAASQLVETTGVESRVSNEKLADIQIQLADLYSQVGQWTKATRLFRRLAKAEAVLADDYRRGTLKLAEGRLAFVQSSFGEARTCLLEARQVFIQYNDHRALATVSRLLADIEISTGKLDEAVPFYTESAIASLSVDDLLASTHIWTSLQKIRKRFTLSEKTESQIGALEERLDRRAYVIRFRSGLLQRFRALAHRLAAIILPVTFLVLSAIHLPLIRPGVTAIITALLCRIIPGCTTPFGDVMGTLFAISASLLPAVWTYGFLYVLVGWVLVRRLPPGDIARLQMEYVVTVPEGITVRDEEKNRLSELPWSDVEAYMSANRAVWRMPIPILSRHYLFSPQMTLVLDGIIRHYHSLQHDIQGRLEQAKNSAAQHFFDYSFLGSRWTVVTLLLVIGMTAVSIFDWLDQTLCQHPNIISVWLPGQRYVYVSSGDGRLQVLNVPSPLELEQASSYVTPGTALSSAVAWPFAFIADGGEGLRIINVENPQVPLEVGYYDTPGQASAVAVSGDYAYVADGNEGLRIVDVEDRQNPVEVGFYDTPGQASAVAVSGGYAYVADGSEGLRIIDVGVPPKPVEVGFYDTPGQALAVAVSGDYAYIADGSEGLRIVDVGNPRAPFEAGVLDTADQILDVTLAGGLAYLAEGNQGFRVVSLKEPDAPTEIRHYDTPNMTTDVAVIFGLAYITGSSNLLQIIDVLNPCSDITEEGHFDMGGPSNDVTVPKEITWPITNVAFELFFWSLLFFPIIGLGRLLYNRSARRRIFGTSQALSADWPFWLALILLIGLALFHTWTLTL